MTARARRPGRVFMKDAEVMPQTDDFHQRIRALEALPSGPAIFEIKVFEDDAVVEAGDGKFKFDIPDDLQDAALVDFEAWVTEPSSSGTVVVSLYNNTQACEMLSTSATIDVGELNDDDSGTPFVIATGGCEVVDYKDELWVNVDNAGTGAQGLGVAVKFYPAEAAAIVVRGARGPAGGITVFEGDWTTTVVYTAGSIVVHNGVTYVSIVDHTSDGDSEPGVGADWEDFWAEIGAIPMSAGWSMNVLSSSGPVPDGIKTAAVMPFDAEISEAVILADQATDAEIDIWVSDFAGYPPSSGDSITGGTPPTLTGAIKNLDSTLSGWTTALAEGDILVFYVSGVTTARRLTLALKVEK